MFQGKWELKRKLLIWLILILIPIIFGTWAIFSYPLLANGSETYDRMVLIVFCVSLGLIFKLRARLFNWGSEFSFLTCLASVFLSVVSCALFVGGFQVLNAKLDRSAAYTQHYQVIKKANDRSGNFVVINLPIFGLLGTRPFSYYRVPKDQLRTLASESHIAYTVKSGFFGEKWILKSNLVNGTIRPLQKTP